MGQKYQFDAQRDVVGNVRSTTRWIVGIFLASISIAITGLVVSDVGRLTWLSDQWFVAIGSLAIGFGAVVWTLFKAARVLTAEVGSVREILALGSKDAGGTAPTLPPSVYSAYVEAIELDRASLFPGFEDLQALLRAQVEAADDLQRSNTDENRQRCGELAEVGQDVTERGRTVLAVQEYEGLIRRVLVAIALVVIATVAYASAVAVPEPVDQPFAVVIYFKTPAVATRHLGCSETHAEGVVVGGDPEKPVVAIPERGRCQAVQITVDGSIGVAVPAL